jgi:hypothetical protein
MQKFSPHRKIIPLYIRKQASNGSPQVAIVAAKMPKAAFILAFSKTEHRQSVVSSQDVVGRHDDLKVSFTTTLVHYTDIGRLEILTFERRFVH